MNKKSILREFQNGTFKTIENVAADLSSIMGEFQRVGGPTRTYDLDSGQHAAVYTVGNGVEGVALGWHDSPNNIRTVYYWSLLDISREPSYAIDLPAGDFSMMASAVVQMLRANTMGKVELN